MKIAVVGSHAVGKTTLVKEIAKDLNYPIVPEFARAMLESISTSRGTEVDKIWQDMDNTAWLQFQATLLIHQSQQANNHGVYDRTPLDSLAYLMVLGGRRQLTGFEQIAFHSLVNKVEWLIRNYTSYDYVIHVPHTILPYLRKEDTPDEEYKLAKTIREEVGNFIAMNLHRLDAGRIITLETLTISEVFDQLSRIGVGNG